MSGPDQNLRLKAGDVRIVAAVLVNKEGQSIDIRDILKEVRIYENIFSPFITGKLVIQDSVGLSTLLPAVGEELLMLEIETPTGNTDKLANRLHRLAAFHVYKMSVAANVAMKSKLYTLDFISIDGFKDMNTAISRTFRGTPSEIAKKLVEEKEFLKSDREAIIEETTNSLIYTSNFWSPARNMFYLAENSVNKKGNPNYFFFENAEGFVFASLDTLVDTIPQQQFFKDQQLRGSKDTVTVDDDYQTILDMSVSDTMFDYIDRNLTGGYGGTVYEMAWDSKTIKKSVKKFDDYSKDNGVNDPNGVSPFSSEAFDPAGHIIHIPAHRMLFNGSNSLSIDHHIRRAATLKHLDNIKTNIQVFGRIDYTVGRQMSLTVYKDMEIDDATPDDVLEDELLSGDYVVTALCHVITNEKHLCNMELCKSSMIAKPRI
jgi:hypothetical protein